MNDQKPLTKLQKLQALRGQVSEQLQENQLDQAIAFGLGEESLRSHFEVIGHNLDAILKQIEELLRLEKSF